MNVKREMPQLAFKFSQLRLTEYTKSLSLSLNLLYNNSMPTTTQHIPSEEELKEMGFMKLDSSFHYLNISRYVDIDYKNQLWILNVDSYEFATSCSTHFFPRDKAHLQSIILAFQPK